MYYCRSCGYRSQGDFCTNRKCNNFGHSREQKNTAAESGSNTWQPNPFNAEDNLRVTHADTSEARAIREPATHEIRDNCDTVNMCDSTDNRNTMNMRDTADSRNTMNMRDTADSRNTMSMRDTADNCGAMNMRDTTDNHNTMNMHDTADNRNTMSIRDMADNRNTMSIRDMADNRNTMNIHDTLDNRNMMGMRDMRDMRRFEQADGMEKCKMPDVPCNEQLQIAFAQVPFQRFGQIYPLDKGLTTGTIFPELDMPYAKRKRLGVY